MEEKTAEEIAAIFNSASNQVAYINCDTSYAAYLSRTDEDVPFTETEWKIRIKDHTDHLELLKGYKQEKEEGAATSIWTTEDFTAIDAAIIKGKSLYS